MSLTRFIRSTRFAKRWEYAFNHINGCFHSVHVYLSVYLSDKTLWSYLKLSLVSSVSDVMFFYVCQLCIRVWFFILYLSVFLPLSPCLGACMRACVRACVRASVSFFILLLFIPPRFVSSIPAWDGMGGGLLSCKVALIHPFIHSSIYWFIHPFI